MKKIFVIISSVLCAFILAFVITVSNVKSNVIFEIEKAYSVVVFDHSTTGTAIEETADLNEFYEQIENITNVTVYDKLVNGVTLSNKIYVDDEGKFATWNTNIKNNNFVIELVYDEIHDLVVYQGDKTRVISYFCLAFVVPETDEFTDIAVYYSLTNETTDNEKDEQYASNTPLVLHGNATMFEKFFDNI